MAISKIRATIPLSIEEAFQRLSDHENLKEIVNQVTTSELIQKSSHEGNENGLGAKRLITFNGDLLTEEIIGWYPPSADDSDNKEPTGKVGYDYKVVKGTPLIADHLGVIRLNPKDENSTQLEWDIHLKVPLWATGEIAAYFVCRSMEKNITESVVNNLK